ncbi:hypothetical protein [Marinobacter zhejiangensis]|uniref:hypothetical protein n=1 Tax=Marinobacter zhejiangensis TaxID=488535 RepID=UPI001587895A|nr:hypothetical protein [Marinobacter zhejiangensis]
MVTIIVAIVISMIVGGNGCSRCRTDSTAEDSTLSATYLVANGRPNRSTKTATQRGIGCVTRNGAQ